MKKLILASLILFACTSRKPPAGARPTHRAAEGDGKTYMFVSPPDMSTSAENLQIAVWAEKQGATSHDLLLAVASRVSLVTWPELATVPVAVALEEPADIYATQPYAKVVVTPTASLAYRWYALKVTQLPDPLVLRPSGAYKLPSGEMVARFRFGAEPQVVQIEELPHASDPSAPYSISVELSEAVPVATATSAITLVGSAVSLCDPIMKYGDVTPSVNWKCSSSVLDGLTVSVGQLSPGQGRQAGQSSTIIVQSSKVVTRADGVRVFKL
jgi:hypothetical protein